jgi:hypothetical protein
MHQVLLAGALVVPRQRTKIPAIREVKNPRK